MFTVPYTYVFLRFLMGPYFLYVVHIAQSP